MHLSNMLANPWLKHLLKAVLSIGIVVYLLNTVDVEGLQKGFANANTSGLILSVIFVILGVVIFQAFEIHASMKADARIPVGKLCNINLALMFYVLFLPAGLTFVIRWGKYRQAGYGGYDSAALVGFHKILQLAVACVFSMASLAFLGASFDTFGTQLLVLSIVGSVVLCGGLVFVLCGKSNLVFGWLSRLGVRKHAERSEWYYKINNKIVGIVEKLSSALGAFGELDRRSIFTVLIYATLQHAFIVLSSWVIVDMVVPGASLVAVAFVRSVVVILLTIPISVGGLGVRELAFYSLFPLFGIPSSAALSASLLLFVVNLIVSALGGLIELFYWLKPATANND